MSHNSHDHLTPLILSEKPRNIFQAFIFERRSRRLSNKSIKFYQSELEYFARFLEQVKVRAIGEVTVDTVRQYFMALSERRNNGGLHCAYRALKAMFNWFDEEFEPSDWRNPMRKVKPPEMRINPLPGISMEDFQHMIDACTTKNGRRDKAILTFLLDTGVRASELISMDIGDIDLKTGAGVIRRGKGGISYAIHVGSRAMRDLRRYLRTRTNLHESAPLFATQYEERLAYAGLRQIIRRRAVAAGVPEPGLHDFRRAFGLQCKRNGMDILTISRLLGHSSVVVTQRYICQDDNDLAEEHKRYSPVDKL